MKTYVLLAGTAFILHLLWETSHVSLYGGYETLSPYLPITVWATIGDVLYTVSAVLLFGFVKRSLFWLRRVGWQDLTALALVGFCISLSIEYKALAFGRWYYLDAMPIIPFFHVGLSPVIQMTLLLPLSVFLTMRLLNTTMLPRT